MVRERMLLLKQTMLSNEGRSKRVNVNSTMTRLLMTSIQRSASARSIYEKNLEDEMYYHGFMSRVEAESYLSQQGHFLVRRIQDKNEYVYILSVKWNGEKLHYKIRQTDHKNFYYLNKACKQTIPSLIRYHRLNHIPVNSKTNACIIKPAERNNYTIYREQIKLGEKLGEGEFGAVYRGVLRTGLFTRIDVAVKTMKTEGLQINMDERIKFLREANIMMRLHHKNVIRLYGVCVYEDPIWIVLEEAKGGSLLDRLEKLPHVSVPLKERFSKQLCFGMQYLESFCVLHRDLAARNCLLDHTDTLKIADFGLSSKGLKSIVIKGGRTKIPIRWMSPETLRMGTFSSKSDVWSYGVVLYEIWSDGRRPFDEVLTAKLVRKGIVTDTLKLKPPPAMTEKYKNIMNLCLTYDEQERPTFKKLSEIIKENC